MTDSQAQCVRRVFATGKGIPISLSVVHAAVGRRAGMRIQYIGSAGHFLNKMVSCFSNSRAYNAACAGRDCIRRCPAAEVLDPDMPATVSRKVLIGCWTFKRARRGGSSPNASMFTIGCSSGYGRCGRAFH